MDLDFGCLLCGDFGPWIDAPFEAQILRGDTLRVRAFGSTDNRGSWRLANDVAAFDDGTRLQSRAVLTDNVLVRGVKVGESFLTFLPLSDTTRSSTVSLAVRDSAEVADIEFWMSATADTLRLKVGEPVQLAISLVDSERHVIHGSPESVTVGDTLVLRRQQFALPPRPGDFAFQGATVGVTDVVATFRHLRRRLVVVVRG